jgi:hypothetical protein
MKKQNLFCNLVFDDIKAFSYMNEVEQEMEQEGMTDDFIDILEKIYDDEEQYILDNLKDLKIEHLQKNMQFEEKDHYQSNINILGENMGIIIDMMVDEVWDETIRQQYQSQTNSPNNTSNMSTKNTKEMNKLKRKYKRKKKKRKKEELNEEEEETNKNKSINLARAKVLPNQHEEIPEEDEEDCLSKDVSLNTNQLEKLYGYEKKEGPTNLKDLKKIYKSNTYNHFDSQKIQKFVKSISKQNEKSFEKYVMTPSYPKKNKSNSKTPKKVSKNIESVLKYLNVYEDNPKPRARAKKSLQIPFKNPSSNFQKFNQELLEDIQRKKQSYNLKRSLDKEKVDSSKNENLNDLIIKNKIKQDKKILEHPEKDDKRKIGSYIVFPNLNKKKNENENDRTSIIEKLMFLNKKKKKNHFLNDSYTSSVHTDLLDDIIAKKHS